MTRRVRGYALGMTVAIILLVAVASVASYYLFQVYTSGYRSLSEYVSSVEKPVFDVAGVDVNGSNVVVTLINKGPHGTHVMFVYLLRYDNSNTSTSFDAYTVDSFVATGGKIQISFPLYKLPKYMGFNRPFRLAVETDNGIVLIGSQPFTSTIVVNVDVPSTIRLDQSQTEVQVVCPPSDNPRTAIFSRVVKIGEGLEVLSDGSIHGEIPVVGLGECRVSLHVEGEWYQIGYQIGNQWSSSKWNPIIGEKTSGRFDTDSYVVLKDEKVSVVDFSLPEFQTTIGNTTNPRQVNPSVIDFSWLYYPNTQNGEAEPSENTGYWSNGNGPVGAIEKIIASGAVTAYSPAGCPVYPPADPYGNQTVPSDVEKALVRYTFLFSHKGYAEVTGVPVMAWGYPDDCRDPSEDTVLVASVKFQLSGGRYLLIPVVGYDDDDGSDNFKSNISLSIQPLEGTGVSLGSYSGEAPSGRGPVQITAPTVVDVPGGGGYYFLRARVTGHGSAKAVAVVFSKVIVVPLGSSRVACTYVAPSLPTFPWASVDVASGTLHRNAKIIFAYAAKDDGRTRYLLMHWVNVTYANNTVFVSPSGVSLSNDTIPENLKKVYVADGYSMSINVSVNGTKGVIYSALVPYKDVEHTNLNFNSPNGGSLKSEVETVKPTLFLYYYAGENDTTLPFINIGIRTYGGFHYVIIPLSYGTRDSTVSPPVVSVSNGEVLYPVSGNWSFVSGNVGRDVVIVSFSGRSTNIRIYPPTDDENHGVFVILGGVYVVRPDYGQSGYPVVPNETYGVPVGIVLHGVRVVTNLGDKGYAELVDTSDGSIIGFWSIPSGSSNVVLGVGGMTISSGYPWAGNMKYFDEYNHYVLILYNMLCKGNTESYISLPPSSFGSSSGSESGSGGSSGNSGSSGGSSGSSRLTVIISPSRTVDLYWVPAVITSSYSGFWSGVSSDGSDVYVTDSSGNPVKYGVYIDKDDDYGVVWIYVNKRVSYGDRLTYYVYYGGTNKYPDHRTGNLFNWLQLTDLNTWNIDTRQLSSTTVTDVSISQDVVSVTTDWSEYADTRTVYTLSSDLVGVKGFYMDITEVGHDTDYEVAFHDVKGNSYNLYISTCKTPTLKLYKNGILVSQKDLGCYSQSPNSLKVGVVLSGESTPSGNYTFTIDSPISFIRIIPVNGDGGDSYFYLYMNYDTPFTYRPVDGVSVSVLS